MAEIEDNIRSEELNEVLGSVPSALVRKGSAIVLFFFISILIFCCVFKFPDTINGRVSISTQTPPARLVAQANGRLNLLVKDGDKVKEHTLLAVINNSSDLNDVLLFESKLNDFQKIALNPSILLKDSSVLNLDLNLGEIQVEFMTFKNACRKFIITQRLAKNERSLYHIKRQFEDQKSLNLLLDQRMRLLQENFKIIKKQYAADSSLYMRKAISGVELEESYQKYLEIKQNINRINQDKIQNDQQLKTLEKLMNETELVKVEDNFELVNQLGNSYKSLVSFYAIWQEKYFLRAPLDGEVTFFDFWNKNQFVQFGSDVMAIVSQSERYVGRVYVKSNRLAKIKSGQKVKIKLDSYPYSQYGILYGKVLGVSELNRDNVYIITISFPNQLVTSYNESIEFKEEMQGNAEIITDDVSIMERLFTGIWQLFANE